jgi:hypothetical protein
MLPPESAQKAQSKGAFELVSPPVQTAAHFVVASRQILDDAPQLMSLACATCARVLADLPRVRSEQASGATEAWIATGR